MLSGAATFVTLFALSPAHGSATTPTRTLPVPALRFIGAPAASHAASGGVTLRSRLLSDDEANAQRRRRRRQDGASDASGAVDEQDGGASGGGDGASGAASDGDPGASGGESSSTDPGAAGEGASEPDATGGDAAPEEEEPDLELLRHRAAITRIHRPLGIMTWASLGVTVALGTMLAINQPTVFGQGLCSSADGYSVLGDFGCGGSLRTLHQVSAFVTVGFYTATGIFALSMPDPERAAAGSDRRAVTLRLHRTMAWVHFVGMVLQPILGAISSNPGFIGVQPEARADFSSVMRTVHTGVGYVTFAALTTAMILEL